MSILNDLVSPFIEQIMFILTSTISNSLRIIDDYCRLRLPDKFLDAYYEAYVLN